MFVLINNIIEMIAERSILFLNPGGCFIVKKLLVEIQDDDIKFRCVILFLV